MVLSAPPGGATEYWNEPRTSVEEHQGPAGNPQEPLNPGLSQEVS
jgi:hypothetical protein